MLPVLLFTMLQPRTQLQLCRPLRTLADLSGLLRVWHVDQAFDDRLDRVLVYSCDTLGDFSTSSRNKERRLLILAAEFLASKHLKHDFTVAT